MRDKNEGFALLFQPAEDTEQVVDFIVGEGCGRLIQNQKLGVCIKGTANFKKLLFTGLQLRDHGGGIHIHTEVFKQLPGPLELLFLVNQAELRFDFAAEKNIVRDGQIVDDIQLLVDECDAGRLHLLDCGAGILFSKEGDGAFIRRYDACQDVHQGAFSCSVFSEKCMDFALFNGKMNI